MTDNSDRELWRRGGTWTITVVLLAVAVPLVAGAWQVRQWNALQKRYFWTYLLTTRPGTGQYSVVLCGNRLATWTDVSVDPRSVSTRKIRTGNSQLHRALLDWIYDEKDVLDLFRWPIYSGILVLAWLPLAIWSDSQEQKRLRAGVIVEGPRKVTIAEWNKRKGVGGVGFRAS